VVIITASFEGNSLVPLILHNIDINDRPAGEPADNAARFVDWLRHIEGNELDNVRFAVFGCGNSDWTSTFQKIPILCDELFEKNGGSRLVARGSGDAGAGDFFQKFDEFEAGLWATLSKVRCSDSCAWLNWRWLIRAR
jgi:cytochrome P450/NADPH-cytochrome P450 reductase